MWSTLLAYQYLARIYTFHGQRCPHTHTDADAPVLCRPFSAKALAIYRKLDDTDRVSMDCDCDNDDNYGRVAAKSRRRGSGRDDARQMEMEGKHPPALFHSVPRICNCLLGKREIV